MVVVSNCMDSMLSSMWGPMDVGHAQFLVEDGWIAGVCRIRLMNLFGHQCVWTIATTVLVLQSLPVFCTTTTVMYLFAVGKYFFTDECILFYVW